MKLKKIFTNWRVLLLLFILLLSLYAIYPQPNAKGVAIRQIQKESAAALAGIKSPEAATTPTQREVVLAINGQPISDVQDYFAITQELPPNATITIQTDVTTYRLVTQPLYDFDEETNASEVIGTADIGLVVYDRPTNNIRKGLDLSGGTRVIMKPEHQVSKEDLDLIITQITERLNVFGLSDISVRSAQDLAGDDFILIEIAGANKDEVRDLLGNQGVFEAKVGNTTVFQGGDDVTFVCRSPECSGIDTRGGGCQPAVDGGWFCRFMFSITLSQHAAESQAAATRDLSIKTEENGNTYLSQPLDLYLDGELVDSLQVSADLKGRAVTDIQISGSGAGLDKRAALEDSLASMKKLQTIMITGSLPVKLDIVKTDAISPMLGDKFVKNAILVGLLAMLAVVVVIFVRYRMLAVSVPMIITMMSEAVIILGFAALVGWNLDLAAIAGIIIAIGTGVDDQIVIVDETLHGDGSVGRSWKDQLKRAFFIIFSSYATTVVAMLPLLRAGAGLLRGFALTTIVGVSIGVLITRPAYAATVEILLKD